MNPDIPHEKSLKDLTLTWQELVLEDKGETSQLYVSHRWKGITDYIVLEPKKIANLWINECRGKWGNINQDSYKDWKPLHVTAERLTVHVKMFYHPMDQSTTNMFLSGFIPRMAEKHHYPVQYFLNWEIHFASVFQKWMGVTRKNTIFTFNSKCL